MADKWEHKVGRFKSAAKRDELMDDFRRTWDDLHGVSVEDIRWFDRALTSAEVAVLAKRDQ